MVWSLQMAPGSQMLTCNLTFGLFLAIKYGCRPIGTNGFSYLFDSA